MIVLGLNGYLNADHDSGAALVIDGTLIAAVEEERLIRQKRALGMSPTGAAAEVLDIAGVSASDVDVIAYPWLPDLLRTSPHQEAHRIVEDLRDKGVQVRADLPVEFVRHHEAHAWSGLYFVDEDRREGCSVLVLDGSGENTSGAQYRFRGGALTAERIFSLESSFGGMYEAATALAGFRWGEEGKLMGLASYVELDLLPEESIKRVTSHLAHEENDGQRFVTDEIYNNGLRRWMRLFANILEEQPRSFVQRARLAAIAQAAFETRAWELVQDLSSPTIVIAGGSALNCSSNGRIATFLSKQDRKLVIPPCANDTGVPMGAAVAVASRKDVIGQTSTAAHGRDLGIEDAARLADESGLCLEEVTGEDIAERLNAGQVIGWLDGRAEIGPRALGGRSIMADPSSTRVRDRVNVMKRRETWRPLAPSVTAAEFCRSFSGVPNQFMLQAADVTEDAGLLEGVTHVDGTARPHVVGEDQQAYKAVLEGFGQLAKRPEAIICTSFNSAGEPMVYSAVDGLRSAQRMSLDAIAGNGWAIDLKR